jgi:putative transposase
MKKARITEEQIIWILREREAGAATSDVCGKQGFSSATFLQV